MHERRVHHADGRYAVLYGRAAIPPCDPPSPPDVAAPGAHLRWHPLRGEWVIHAGHRHTRTFVPPLEPARLAGPWDVAVVEARSPALGAGGEPPAHVVETAPARGRCEVMIYAPDPRASLAALPPWQVELVIAVWAARTAELGDRGDVHYVCAFENRGAEAGGAPPYGGIHGYPFVPAIAARGLDAERAHFESTGRGLLADLIHAEIEDARRVLYVSPHAISFVPACARWTYECWVAPRRLVPRLGDLDADERRDLAHALRDILRRLDGLWGKPMPYALAVHQAPTRGAHRHAHARIEIYPRGCAGDRMKQPGAAELAMGVFTVDTAPEDAAAELRAVVVP